MPAFRHRAPEEAEMAVVRRQFVMALHAGLEIVPPDMLVQVIGGNGLQGDGRNDPERAERDAGGEQQVGVGPVHVQNRAVRLDEAQPRDLRGEAAEREAGAMGAGGEGPGDGLRVDIALVGERKTQVLQRPTDIADPRAGRDRHVLALDLQNALIS